MYVALAFGSKSLALDGQSLALSLGSCSTSVKKYLHFIREQSFSAGSVDS